MQPGSRQVEERSSLPLGTQLNFIFYLGRMDIFKYVHVSLYPLTKMCSMSRKKTSSFGK